MRHVAIILTVDTGDSECCDVYTSRSVSGSTEMWLVKYYTKMCAALASQAWVVELLYVLMNNLPVSVIPGFELQTQHHRIGVCVLYTT